MAPMLTALLIIVFGGPIAMGEPAPGDALELDPPPARIPSDTAAPLRSDGESPVGVPISRFPFSPIDVGAVVAAGGATVAVRTARSRRRDDEPLVVVVHGHGGSAHDFDDLIDLMGVDADQVVAFDYTTVDGGTSSTESSRVVSSARTAEALDRFIRSLAERHSHIYSIHHSKGAAAGALMIAGIDDGRRPPIDGYRGAALLDPPMARGFLGGLQSAGQIVRWIPDDGGFDPITCDLTSCHDLRPGLGHGAGVEVVMIRNPDAAITNLATIPDDLRVLDLVDDGGRSAWERWWNPIAFARRVFEAHGSVLRHEAVARCLSAEVEEPGSCSWTGGRRRIAPLWGSGGGRNLVR